MRGAWRATRWKSCRREIRLTLGLNDVLLLRNLDDVPQVFGPTIMMPGQSFRLPFEKAAEYQFACTAHASGQMTVVVEPEPGDAVAEDPLARARVVGEQERNEGSEAIAAVDRRDRGAWSRIWWAAGRVTKSVIFPDALGRW